MFEEEEMGMRGEQEWRKFRERFKIKNRQRLAEIICFCLPITSFQVLVDQSSTWVYREPRHSEWG